MVREKRFFAPGVWLMGALATLHMYGRGDASEQEASFTKTFEGALFSFYSFFWESRRGAWCSALFFFSGKRGHLRQRYRKGTACVLRQHYRSWIFKLLLLRTFFFLLRRMYVRDGVFVPPSIFFRIAFFLGGGIQRFTFVLVVHWEFVHRGHVRVRPARRHAAARASLRLHLALELLFLRKNIFCGK